MSIPCSHITYVIFPIYDHKKRSPVPPFQWFSSIKATRCLGIVDSNFRRLSSPYCSVEVYCLQQNCYTRLFMKAQIVLCRRAMQNHWSSERANLEHGLAHRRIPGQKDFSQQLHIAAPGVHCTDGQCHCLVTWQALHCLAVRRACKKLVICLVQDHLSQCNITCKKQTSCSDNAL